MEQQRRVLGGLAAFTLVSGSMLGIGIFIYPAQVARLFTTNASFLLVWALGGLFALSGAVAYAELGAMFPRAGGDYEFLREGFNESVAFAAGWLIFGAAFTGSIATMTVALAQYQIPSLVHALRPLAMLDFSAPLLTGPWGFTLDGTRLVAVGLIVAVSALNMVEARVAGWLQTLTTLLPIGLMTLIALWALGSESVTMPAAGPTPPDTGWVERLDDFTSAYMAIYFAYAGWNAVIYVAGEVQRPHRTLVRALVAGTLCVTALYVLLCAAFLRVFGIAGLATAGEAGSAMAGVLGGDKARLTMTALIASAIVASVNATVLGGARVAFAMARRGAFWSWAGHLAPDHGVPRRALAIQAIGSCLYVLTGTFEQVYQLTSLAMVAGGTLTVVVLFVLRRTRPTAPRPYRATGYPWLPALYVLSSVVVLAMMVRRAFGGSAGSLYPLAGLGIMVVAYAAHRMVLARGWRDGANP